MQGQLPEQSQELRERLELAWTYVGPGCSHADDPRYLARFLELLRAYEEAEDRLRASQGQVVTGPGHKEQLRLEGGT